MSDGIKLFLAAITAMVVFVAVFITLGHAHEYEITGHNALTGERVAGTMADTAHNGTVHGLILDRRDRVPVAGTWSGKGLARMHGEGQTYKVEVVE